MLPPPSRSTSISGGPDAWSRPPSDDTKELPSLSLSTRFCACTGVSKLYAIQNSEKRWRLASASAQRQRSSRESPGRSGRNTRRLAWARAISAAGHICLSLGLCSLDSARDGFFTSKTPAGAGSIDAVAGRAMAVTRGAVIATNARGMTSQRARGRRANGAGWFRISVTRRTIAESLLAMAFAPTAHLSLVGDAHDATSDRHLARATGAPVCWTAH